jgi:hypothetical protein
LGAVADWPGSERGLREHTLLPLGFAVVCFLLEICGSCCLGWASDVGSGDHTCDIVLQISESERGEGKPPYAAFLYDDMLRRQVANRAQKNDPTLDLNEVFGKRDKELLSIAMQRLYSVLRHADLRGPSLFSGAGLQGYDQSRQAAQTFSDNNAKAAEALANQQQQLLLRANTMGNQAKGGGKGGGKKGGKKGGMSSADKKKVW